MNSNKRGIGGVKYKKEARRYKKGVRRHDDTKKGGRRHEDIKKGKEA